MTDNINSQVFDSTSQNTNPSMSVNFIRNILEGVDANNFTINYTTITLEIIMSNFEPLQVLNFFNSSAKFIEECANKVVAMYSSEHLKKLNTLTSPQVSLTFTRVPKSSSGIINLITQAEENLLNRYFLSNITIQISECEINRITTAFALAKATIVDEINDAVALYNTDPVYPNGG